MSDLHGSIWNAYHSDVWPNRYLIDQNSAIVLHIESEGNNRPMEEKIRELLAGNHLEVSQIPLDPPESSFAPSCGNPTNETYVGDWFHRGALANPQEYDDGSVTDFRAAGDSKDGGVMLSAKWRTEDDGVTSGDNSGRAVLRYHARSIYAVLSVADPKKPVRVNVLQDGKALDKYEAGIDIHFDSHGSYLEIGNHECITW